MSKKVAVIAVGGEVVRINVQSDHYQIEPYEVLVSNAAWVGGDYVGGIFYPPKPFPSWTRGDGEWLPPVPMPDDGHRYQWDEAAQEWQSVTE